jgi:hypothetical protein
MPAPVDIFDDACLHFGGGTLGHPWGNALVAVAIDVLSLSAPFIFAGWYHLRSSWRALDHDLLSALGSRPRSGSSLPGWVLDLVHPLHGGSPDTRVLYLRRHLAAA